MDSAQDIRASLQKHAKAFDDLLRLIPPKFYLPDFIEDSMNKRFMKHTNNETDASKKDAKRKGMMAKKLDPESVVNKTVQEIQAEKLEKQQDTSKKDKDNAMDVDDEEDFDMEDGEQKEVRPMAASGSITALRDKLQARIQSLRQKRHAPEDDSSRQALLEKRMKRKKPNKKKTSAFVSQEQVLGTKTPKMMGDKQANGDHANGGSAAHEVKSNIYYGKLTTGAMMKKKSVHVKQQLAKVENKKKERDELRRTDSERADMLETKDKWGKALDQAKGEKVKDDPTLLRKTIRRDEQQKKKSSREWNERKNQVQTKMKERAQKREANLKARVDAKKMKKQGKSKQSIAKMVSSAKQTNGGSKKSKARPGFEGK